MNVRIFFSFAIAITGVILGYINVIPSYVSECICIIVLIGVLVSILKDYINTFNKSVEHNQEVLCNLLRSFEETNSANVELLVKKQTENFTKINDMLSQCFEPVKDQIGLLCTNIDGNYKKSIEAQNECLARIDSHFVESFNKINDLLSQHFELIKGQVNLLCTNIDDNYKKSIEVQNDCFSKVDSNLSNCLDTLNKTLVKVTTELSAEITKSNQELSSAINDNVKESQEITNSLEEFKKSNITLSSKQSEFINNLIKSNNELVVSSDRNSNKLSEKLTEFSSKIELLQKEINEITEGQKNLVIELQNLPANTRKTIKDFENALDDYLEKEAETIDENTKEYFEGIKTKVSDINSSIKSLISAIQSSLNKLSLDVEDMCSAVSDLNKNTQDINKADSDLLDKINKLCK